MNGMNPSRSHLEGGSGELHGEILAAGQTRFPEESYHQLRVAGASEAEALQMLGYGLDRKPLEESGDEEPE